MLHRKHKTPSTEKHSKYTIHYITINLKVLYNLSCFTFAFTETGGIYQDTWLWYLILILIAQRCSEYPCGFLITVSLFSSGFQLKPHFIFYIYKLLLILNITQYHPPQQLGSLLVLNFRITVEAKIPIPAIHLSPYINSLNYNFLHVFVLQLSCGWSKINQLKKKKTTN